MPCLRHSKKREARGSSCLRLADRCSSFPALHAAQTPVKKAAAPKAKSSGKTARLNGESVATRPKTNNPKLNINADHKLGVPRKTETAGTETGAPRKTKGSSARPKARPLYKRRRSARLDSESAASKPAIRSAWRLPGRCALRGGPGCNMPAGPRR